MATFFKETNLQTLVEKISNEQGFKKPHFTITSATNPGENFIGEVYRVKVTETSETQEKECLSLILKKPSSNTVRKEKISSDALFRTEGEMYDIVLPTLNNFLKKYGLSSSSAFPGTARCFAVEKNVSGETDAIVLEDKSVDGFRMGDLKGGLDADQCYTALDRVALLHSSFLALRQLEPQTADRLSKLLDKDVWRDEKDPVIADFKRSIRDGLELLGEPFTEGNPVHEKLCKILENFSEELAQWNDTPQDIACITHGDFWANNILFKRCKDGIVEDACLIDFQLSSLNSPINDIASFIFICTTKEVRDLHYEKFIQFYHDQVSQTLRGCGYDPRQVIPWTRFQKHLIEYGRFGVLGAIGSLPVLMADKSEFKGDIHSEDGDNLIFAGRAKIENPETLKMATQRLNGVVTDARRLGYI